MAKADSSCPRRAGRSLRSITVLSLVVAAVVAAVFAAPAATGQEPGTASHAGALRAADLVALAKRFSNFSDDLPPAALLGVEKILAYEEHPHFVFIRGRGQLGDRRVVFCKPSLFVIHDIPRAEVRSWRLRCGKAPKITGGQFSVTEGAATIHGQALLQSLDVKASRADGENLVEVSVNDPAILARFLQSIHVGGDDAALPQMQLTEEDGSTELKLTVGKRTFQLTLPAAPSTPGTIAVSQAGKPVLAERILPAGILPHGSQGVQELARWDSAYRRDGAPGWDVGRPATELKNAVESGAIKPGRALVLGCGAGTNAIYLASKGFEVTGVDIAPTALGLAEERARKKGVRVKWRLADVLAVPEIGPFDFIFDRGCYHHVRRYNAAGYVETIERLSDDNTRFLLLAGNANEPVHRGPPRVEETELVGDFASTWDIVWLKEIRFDSANPEARNGPWAWSLLLRHKPQKD